LKATYYSLLFIGSIILLLSTFYFVLPFEPDTIELIHKLAKWVLYGFILEFTIGIIRAKDKLGYVKQEWISLTAILVSISLESFAGMLGVVKLAKLAKLVKAMKGIKAVKLFKAFKSVKVIKTVKLGKKTRKARKARRVELRGRLNATKEQGEEQVAIGLSEVKEEK